MESKEWKEGNRQYKRNYTWEREKDGKGSERVADSGMGLKKVELEKGREREMES